MDEIDNRILEALKEDSSNTIRKISNRARVPITTAHNRVKKLKKEGVIKRYTIEIDYKKIGKALSAIILVNFDYKLLRDLKKDQHEMAEEIKSLPEVETADIVTGETDMVIKVRVKDVEEFDIFLLKKLQKIAGIDKTKSLIVIH